uniref:ethanolamine-phosphate cytidylyltransferase n=1 Tax=Trypanosoma congolense (strain IL3000) TaxID=1068625 RepID=G0V2Q6_TRYCI|nr:unnamed protein product [Trypanosoma congolense IL3000]
MNGSTSKVCLNADYPDDPYPLYATSPLPPKRPGTTRVWVDGCFDMLHFGHANALRQAKSLGDELFVGCHSDAEIILHKGLPVMHEEERYEALRGCKWVDFVVEGYPYVTRVEDMMRFGVDYVVHGDDISVDLEGRNSYQAIIDAGMFKVVKRTESISTTDLVSRMLRAAPNKPACAADKTLLDEEVAKHPPTRYLTTSRKIAQFSNNRPPPRDGKIVYVQGSFDLFHVGHVQFLKKARALGDYLVVGLYDDQTIRGEKGELFPIMSLNERVLGVLSCRHVDEVIFGVPGSVTREMITSLGIRVVACGSMVSSPIRTRDCDALTVPRELGILQEIESTSSLSTNDIIERVVKNWTTLVERQSKKRLKDRLVESQKPELYRNVTEF